MNQIYPDEGLIPLLERIIVGDFMFHLFTNEPAEGLTVKLADLVEAAYSGYEPITVEADDFINSAVVDNVGTILAEPIEFLNESGATQEAAGYYATNLTQTKLLFYGLFDAEDRIKLHGEAFGVTPMVSVFSQFIA